MIASYVNDNRETWDQFLREFAYVLRTTVNETTGKTPAELFWGRKLITPFQKLVMVSEGTEFVVGDIEKLFEEARKNTKVKHEKWAKYYNRRRRDVRIRIKSEYIIKGSDENVIKVGSSVNRGSGYQASSLYGVRPRSYWSQNSKNSESGERGKMTGLKKDQGDRGKTGNDKCNSNVGSKESSLQICSWTKKSRKEVMGYKRSIHTSRSGGSEGKRSKGPVRQGDK
ncbi:uncharacterized protein TNCV_2363581 [Trichonephila clavipes]|nr:uncharacterized protein TNCV_2363581 [Trichonephila clavipes]